MTATIDIAPADTVALTVTVDLDVDWASRLDSFQSGNDIDAQQGSIDFVLAVLLTDAPLIGPGRVEDHTVVGHTTSVADAGPDVAMQTVASLRDLLSCTDDWDSAPDYLNMVADQVFGASERIWPTSRVVFAVTLNIVDHDAFARLDPAGLLDPTRLERFPGTVTTELTG